MLYCQIMYNFGFPRYDLLYCETSSREGLKYMFSLPENLTTEKSIIMQQVDFVCKHICPMPLFFTTFCYYLSMLI